jgi:hypothetical protein
MNADILAKAAYFIVQWQTKECYIGQRWTKDADAARELVNEHLGREHQSLQCFMVSNTGEIKEVSL